MYVKLLMENFASFDEFLVAVKSQIKYHTDNFVASANAQIKKRDTEGDPKILILVI